MEKYKTLGKVIFGLKKDKGEEIWLKEKHTIVKDILQ